jgi:hypothetical protein
MMPASASGLLHPAAQSDLEAQTTVALRDLVRLARVSMRASIQSAVAAWSSTRQPRTDAPLTQGAERRACSTTAWFRVLAVRPV